MIDDGLNIISFNTFRRGDIIDDGVFFCICLNSLSYQSCRNVVMLTGLPDEASKEGKVRFCCLVHESLIVFHFLISRSISSLYFVSVLSAASMVENDSTVVIDASTAFRVDDNWTYGFPGKFFFRLLVIEPLGCLKRIALISTSIRIFKQ